MILKEKLEEVRQYESLIWNFSCQSADCDTELITIIREALNFSIQNLFIIHDGYKYEMYWFEIVNGSICGAVGTLLDKEERLKKSKNIAHFFMELTLQEKWKGSRFHFIFILQIMKRKSNIVYIASHPAIWEADGFTQFALVEALYKLRIPGFSREFLEMKKIAERDGDKQMLNFITRYLANEHKYKHFSVFLEKKSI